MAEQIRETTDTPACDESLTSKLPSNVPRDVPSNAPRNTIEKWLGLTPRPRFADTLIGETLGAYRIKSILGQSTTSTVYLADRTDQLYSAAAAIKLLNHDVASVTLRQFVVEKYTLGQLNHPGIARLYDAGELADGRPYLVMEYVEGEPLDRYCDNRQLGIRERIELFIKVCSAVDCAHQQLVVHRDLKPGNILVTREGNPKLLDFGIAKWLDTSRLPDTGQAMTRLVDRVLTPEYASPEQIAGELTTTTSDIYTLGVVLYELLSGSRPYQLPDHDFLATEKLICIQDPTSPSQCFGTQPDADQQRLAELRKETPNSLLNALHGDLDAIVMRALRKEPTQRYESVEQFTDDLTRYLHHAPVLARQGNWLYYSRRFVTRHWVGLSAAAVFLVCTAAMAAALVQNTRQLIAERNNAAQQLHRADAASQFWLGMFDRDSSLPPDQPVTAVNLLDRAAAQIKQDTQLTPDIRAQLLVGIGKAYQAQGKPQQATPFLDEAIGYLESHSQDQTLLLANALEAAGGAQSDKGNIEDAINSLQFGVDLLQSQKKTSSEIYFRLIQSLGVAKVQRGLPKEGERYLLASLSLAQSRYGKKSKEAAKTLTLIAGSQLWLGKHKEAATFYEEAISIYDEILPASHPYRVSANLNLVYAIIPLGRMDEAKKLTEKQLPIYQQYLGTDSIYTAFVLDYLSSIETAMGNHESAITYSRKALSISETILGKSSGQTAMLMTALAKTLAMHKENREAEKHLLRALSIFGSNYGNDPTRFAAEYLLASIYSSTQREQPAILILNESIKRSKDIPESQWRIARCKNLLAAIQWKKTHSPESKQLLIDSWIELSNPENYALPEVIEEARVRTKKILGTLPDSITTPHQ